jgi:hypothetical protein
MDMAMKSYDNDHNKAL